MSEPGAEEAVDDKVGGGVDDEEDVGDEAEEDDPDGETSKDSATTDLDLLMQNVEHSCAGRQPGEWRVRGG